MPKSILKNPDDAEIDIKVEHARTGYVVSGNYRPIKVKDIRKQLSRLGLILSIKYNTDKSVSSLIEFMTVDTLSVDLLKNETLRIGGVVVLRKDVAQEYRLVLKNSHGEKEVQWFFPSPEYGNKYPDNPNAQRARFNVEGVEIDKENMIYLYNDEGNKIPLIYIFFDTKEHLS